MSDDFKGSGNAAVRAMLVIGAVLVLGVAGLLGYIGGGGEWRPTAQRRPPGVETETPGPAVPQTSEADPRDVAPSATQTPGMAAEPAEPQPRAPSDATDPVPQHPEERPGPELRVDPVEPVEPEAGDEVEEVEEIEAGEEMEAGDTEPLDRATTVVGDLLAVRTPLEVRDVELGQHELVRTVTVAERERRVIWGLPQQGSHASHISYAIDAGYERLEGTAIVVARGVEVPSDTGDGPAAVFRLYGDSNLLWESEPVRGPDASQGFDVSVRDVEVLVLVVENLTPGTEAGFAWADLQLFGEPAS